MVNPLLFSSFFLFSGIIKIPSKFYISVARSNSRSTTIIIIYLVMLISYIGLYSNVKLSEEVLPSALTSSVVVPEYSPPMSRTSPSSPPQQRYPYLFCLSVTEVVVNCPVVGFNNRQDCRVDESQFPPHRSRPQ